MSNRCVGGKREEENVTRGTTNESSDKKAVALPNAKNAHRKDEEEDEEIKAFIERMKSVDKRVKQQYREINNKAIKGAIRDHKRRKRQFKIRSILGEVKDLKSIPSTMKR